MPPIARGEDQIVAEIVTELPTRTLAEGLAARLRSRIQGGELAAGDRLPAQRDLARELGVARPTLQHALRVLQDEGYVETRRGASGGTFVKQLDRPAEIWFETVRNGVTELEDILAFRSAIECEVAIRAARLRSDDDLTRLRRSQDLIAGATSSAEFRRADALFHAALAAASGSPRLEEAARRVRGELFSPIDRALRPQLVKATLIDHGLILDAIAASDPERAATAIRAHIETTRRELRIAVERTTST